jgi:hypothetical protein
LLQVNKIRHDVPCNLVKQVQIKIKLPFLDIRNVREMLYFFDNIVYYIKNYPVFNEWPGGGTSLYYYIKHTLIAHRKKVGWKIVKSLQKYKIFFVCNKKVHNILFTFDFKLNNIILCD